MPTAEIAAKVYGAVEEYYDSTRKSDNKSYPDLSLVAPEKREAKARRSEIATLNDELHKAQTAKFGRLNERYRPAVGEENDPTYVMAGRLYLHMKAQILNCGELSRIACAEAYDLKSPANVFTFDRFDHEFCVIGTTAAQNSADGTKVTALDRLSAVDLYVVDVWMRICCPIHSYGTEVLRVLDSWTGKGKRIAGLDERDDTIWLVPNGTGPGGFQSGFLASKIKIA